ncbi:pirin family protein [Tuwongella immobilis]|uniref:Pirin N-terminal domain-containing protein n=1 Tax=Tuwongella immobilis TaxID=692036 RepID=A0A6C2YQX7_9BACT|nr:pirin family protein [Tuwongella immobilis]VIP03503.1 quercetin -dioxygenase : Pirin family protein OS=Planctomyces maris DSM 8797 GN=PM8797T_22458 PE=3 SV=1: Pirin [Tuwongella immobilis]VTS04374.1 quercetin -dioxygenase : Pirin family protein OS=Planctomyces maris DSM 8797 GN=PM8797T_22458 PE=3 SV=1: Pirin [Tuwongella immobilis]
MLMFHHRDRRGAFDHGWLKTYHSFSFGEFYDPNRMRFRTLRVMNEDYVLPGQGFGMHPHRDMEILTYVISGSIEHRDSLGSRGVISAGEWQRMTAGSGILHSEYNPSSEEQLHLYQIWLLPNQKGLPPSYEQRVFAPLEQTGWRWIASIDGRNDSLKIHQDSSLLRGRIDAGQTLHHPLAAGRGAWVQAVAGDLVVNGQRLLPGDGLAVEDESQLELVATVDSEVLAFDLA